MKWLVFCTAALGLAWLAGGAVGSGSADSRDPPGQPMLIAPEDGAAAVSLSPVLDVAVSDPDGDPVTVLFIGKPVTAPAHPPFSLVTIPDTQNYSSSIYSATPKIFRAQTRWIVDKRDSLNVAFVAHDGDVVQWGDRYYTHWDSAWSAMKFLENPSTTHRPYGIPYSVALGNHDMPGVGYDRIFGVSRFEGRPYYGGHFGSNNNNSVSLFSASGIDFVVLTLENNAAYSPAVLSWGDSVLAAHPQRWAIVSSHNLIYAGNPAPFSDRGQAIYDALKDNPNLFLMVCGHAAVEGRRSDTYNGRTVHTIMADYQSRPIGGSGWLRVNRICPDENAIHVSTYSPWLDQYEADADSSSQFTLPIDIQPNSGWRVIGYVKVPSGSRAAVTWEGLLPFTEYEWYTVATDEREVVTSPTWHFTTGSQPPVVRVVSPNGSETLSIDHTAALQWIAADDAGVTSVDLLVSRTGVGGPYDPIVRDIGNTGSYTWTVEGPETQTAYFKVTARDQDDRVAEDVSNSPFTIEVYDPTGVRETRTADYSIEMLTANPVRGVGSFCVAVPRRSHVRVAVYNVLGQEVTVLADRTYEPGRHTLVWDGQTPRGPASSGVYFIKMETLDGRLTRKVVFVR